MACCNTLISHQDEAREVVLTSGARPLVRKSFCLARHTSKRCWARRNLVCLGRLTGGLSTQLGGMMYSVLLVYFEKR